MENTSCQSIICGIMVLIIMPRRVLRRKTEEGSTSAGWECRIAKNVEVEEVENLKILADTSSVEVFVNDGEYVFSTRYYPEVYKLQAEAVGAQITLSEIM